MTHDTYRHRASDAEITDLDGQFWDVRLVTGEVFTWRQWTDRDHIAALDRCAELDKSAARALSALRKFTAALRTADRAEFDAEWERLP